MPNFGDIFNGNEYDDFLENQKPASNTPAAVSNNKVNFAAVFNGNEYNDYLNENTPANNDINFQRRLKDAGKSYASSLAGISGDFMRGIGQEEKADYLDNIANEFSRGLLPDVKFGQPGYLTAPGGATRGALNLAASQTLFAPISIAGGVLGASVGNPLAGAFVAQAPAEGLVEKGAAIKEMRPTSTGAFREFEYDKKPMTATEEQERGNKIAAANTAYLALSNALEAQGVGKILGMKGIGQTVRKMVREMALKDMPVGEIAKQVGKKLLEIAKLTGLESYEEAIQKGISNWGQDKEWGIVPFVTWAPDQEEEFLNTLVPMAGLAALGAAGGSARNAYKNRNKDFSGINAVVDAYNQHNGETMENGEVGCVEAVGKIGGHYNPTLAEASKNGIVEVGNLMNFSAERGVPVVPFNPGSLEAGDVIVYGNEKSDGEHALIYDGAGGYVGNSSSQNKIVHGEDYTAMDNDLVPTYIIKTGAGGNMVQEKAKTSQNEPEIPQETKQEVQEAPQNLYADNFRLMVESGVEDNELEFLRMIVDANPNTNAIEDINKADKALQSNNPERIRKTAAEFGYKPIEIKTPNTERTEGATNETSINTQNNPAEAFNVNNQNTNPEPQQVEAQKQNKVNAADNTPQNGVKKVSMADVIKTVYSDMMPEDNNVSPQTQQEKNSQQNWPFVDFSRQPQTVIPTPQIAAQNQKEAQQPDEPAIPLLNAPTRVNNGPVSVSAERGENGINVTQNFNGTTLSYSIPYSEIDGDMDIENAVKNYLAAELSRRGKKGKDLKRAVDRVVKQHTQAVKQEIAKRAMDKATFTKKEIAELKRKAKAIVEARPELEETIERVVADLDNGGRIAEVAAQYINDQYEQIQAEGNASRQEKAEKEQTKKAAENGDNDVELNEKAKTPDEIKAEIQSLANSAWDDKEYRGRVEFSPSNKLRSKVKELFGHDIDTVFITDSDVRHIKKEHSQHEEKRGQVNLTPEDIADLYDVVNNFDDATLENVDNLSNKKMLVVRSNNGMSYALLIERGKRKVQIKTAYKYKKKASVEMTDAQSPRRNARNDSLVKPSSVAPNVTEKTGKVNGEPGNTNNAYKLQYNDKEKIIYVSPGEGNPLPLAVKKVKKVGNWKTAPGKDVLLHIGKPQNLILVSKGMNGEFAAGNHRIVDFNANENSAFVKAANSRISFPDNKIDNYILEETRVANENGNTVFGGYKKSTKGKVYPYYAVDGNIAIITDGKYPIAANMKYVRYFTSQHGGTDNLEFIYNTEGKNYFHYPVLVYSKKDSKVIGVFATIILPKPDTLSALAEEYAEIEKIQSAEAKETERPVMNQSPLSIIKQMPKDNDMPKARNEKFVDKFMSAIKVENVKDNEGETADNVEDNNNENIKEATNNVEERSESGSPDAGYKGLQAEPAEKMEEAGDRPAGLSGEISGQSRPEREGNAGGNEGEHTEKSRPAGVRAGTELEAAAGEGAGERGGKSAVPLTEAQKNPSPAETPGHNYEIKDSDVKKTEAVRYKQNIEAIKLLKQLEAEDRMPTPSEQEILAQYNGWGGLKKAFLEDEKWNEELRSILTKEEYEAARGTINDAFYTSPDIVRAVWEGVSRLGFKGGRILDPSMGIGNFFGCMPRDMMKNSRLNGVEIDSLTSRFAKMLYPGSSVRNAGFQNVKFADNQFDLVISNIPFGQAKIDGYQIHNYFFVHGIDKVRPGGLMVYITSQGSLSSGQDAEKMRNYLNEKAQLVAAYKLPENAFTDSGTKVVTDIVIFRKKDNAINNAKFNNDFLRIKQIGSLARLNAYFDKFKENVIGKLVIEKNQYYQDVITVKPDEGKSVGERLREAMDKLPTDVYKPLKATGKQFDTTASDKQDMKLAKGRDSEYYLEENGEVYQNQYEKAAPVKGKKGEAVKAYIKIKNALNSLLVAQRDPAATDKQLEILRGNLNKEYDAFRKKYGALNDSGTEKYFNDDPSAGMVQALENVVYEGKGRSRKLVKAEKSAIFTERTVAAYREVTKADTPKEALLASLNKSGTIDIDYMAKLLGTTPEKTVAALEGQGLVFKNPATEAYETRNEYLSGNVREKLLQAEAAADDDKAYKRNVDELKKVIPEDLVSSEIKVNMGASWIPVSDLQEFINKAGNYVTVQFVPALGKYSVEGHGWSSKYRTEGITFGDLIDCILNNKPISIYLGRGEDRVFSKDLTDAANATAERIKEDFTEWLWSDKEREKRLVRYYNDNYNNTVVQEYDGSHLTFPGMNSKITLKPHQKNVIWRMLQGGNTLIAHCVGAGKTFEMQAAGMEMRRLGVAKKPLYCLPNNIVEQFTREFRQLYPNAKLLVVTTADLPAPANDKTITVKMPDGTYEEQKAPLSQKEKDDRAKKQAKRNRTLARIQTEDWDGIIMAQTVFERMPVTNETAAAYMRERIDTLENTIRAAKGDKNGRITDKRTLSNLTKRIEDLENKLVKILNDKTERDYIGIPFEELGIDQIFVDEADMYKNLEFETTLGNISGITNSNANRSQDMYLKTRWLTETQGGRGVVFATGTPISNTMAEMYTMMKYLNFKGLKEKGVELFDNWVRNFAQIGTGYERSSAGNTYQKKTKVLRFINMADLIKMFRSFTDVKRIEDLDLNIPKLKNGKPTVITLEPDPGVVDYIKNEVPKRLEEMKGSFKKSKGEDNMLALTNDLRKMTMTDGKINACAGQIANKYFETEDVKGAQLVFCDMGVPKAQKANVSENDDVFTEEDDKEDKSVYEKLIRALVEKGVPREQIAFIQQAKNKEEADEICQKVNSGEIRVLIGTTAKMGAGTNCQKHLVALHDLNAPWRPRDLEQRHGRILRQGNENKEVEIFHYVLKDSFDANMWEKLKNKAAIIAQAMSGDTTLRVVEDADLVTLEYSDIEGQATGDPLVKERLKLQSDVTKYSNAIISFQRQQREAERTVAEAPANISYHENIIEKVKQDISERRNTKGDKFRMLVGKTVYTERKEANEALQKILKVFNKSVSTQIGEIGGFKLMAFVDSSITVNGHPTIAFQLVKNRAYSVNTSSVQGIENTLNNAPEKELEYQEKRIQQENQNEADARETLKRENPYTNKLKEAQNRLNEITRELEKRYMESQGQSVEETPKAEEAAEIGENPVEETKTDERPVEETAEAGENPVETVQETEKEEVNDKESHFETGFFKHTKTGELIPSATINGYTNNRHQYDKIAAVARKLGGYYSRYSKGFLFKTEEDRDAFVQRADKLFSITAGSLAENEGPITKQEVKKAFTGCKVDELGDTTYRVTLPNGELCYVNSENHIVMTKKEEEQARKDHNIKDGVPVVANGYYVDGDGFGQIVISQERNDGTIHHETFHFAKRFLTDEQNKTLERYIKSEEKQGDAYADYRNGKKFSSTLSDIFKTVKTFIDGIQALFGNREAQARVNQAKAEKVFDDIISGKVWKQQRNTGKTGNNAAMSITDKLGLDAEKERQDNENREAANYIDKKLADPKVLNRIKEKHTPQEICEYLLEDYNRAILAISKQREIAIRKKEQLLIDSLGNILKNLTVKRFYRRRAFYERGFFENVRGLLRGNANGRKDSFLEGVLSPKWAESFRARFEDYIRALIPNDYRFQNDYVDKIEQELFEKEKERLKHSAQKRSAFSIDKKFSVTPAQDKEYTDLVNNYMTEDNESQKETIYNKIKAMVEKAAENAGFSNTVPEQTMAYTVRTKAAPKKTKTVYKVFTVDDNGRPSALFISSKDTLPQNVWLDANDTFHFTDNKNGRMYVPSTKNPNTDGGKTGAEHLTSDISDSDLAKLEELGYIKKNPKTGKYPKSITALAYRPGWHAGDLPFFPQGGKRGDGTTNYENIHRYNQVVFECEIAWDKDYSKTHKTKEGQIKYDDMQSMPIDGGYRFATNPMTNAQDLGAWYISGSLKIKRALSEEECNAILKKNGYKPQEWQAYGAGNDFAIGKLDLARLGYTGEEYDAARKTLAPITYDDNGNVIPLSQRFNPNNDDIRYLTEPNDEKGRPRAMDEDGLSLYSRNNEPIYLSPEQRKEYDRKRKQVFDTAVDFVKKAGIKVVTDLKEVRKALSQNGLAEKYAVGTALTEETKQEIETLRKQYGDKVGIAPNGKKSNLTDYQWLLVRTKAFKEWFGDWEKAATAKIIKKLPAINLSLSNSKLSKKEAEAIFEGFGEQKNDRYGVTAAFPKNTVGKIIRHKGFDVTQIIEDLPRLFSSSILAYSNDEELKEGHKAHPNIVQYHNFVNKFTAEGKTYYIRFTMYEPKVKRGSTDKRILHSTGISDIEIYNEKDAALQQDRVIYPAETSTASFVDYKLSQFFNDVKNVSKVVDENGEPMVVYHGTESGGHEEFSIDYARNEEAIWFAKDKAVAEEYAEHDPDYEYYEEWDKPQVYSVFLNLRNPKVIDAKGKTYFDIENDISEAVNSDNDGVIVRSVIDNRFGDSPNGVTTTYAVKDSTQIKSIDNNGNFDANNPNINYLRTEEGIVYGFVKDGVVYLDSEKFDTSAPVHEYVHIWVEAVRKAKPELWARGVELLKQHIRLWNDIKNHPAYSNIAHDDNLIASEMLARLSGNEADRIFSELQRKGRGKLADKIKAWVNEVWQTLKDTFARWTKRDLDKLTLREFVNMPVRDLVKGVDLSAVAKERQTNHIQAMYDIKGDIEAATDKIGKKLGLKAGPNVNIKEKEDSLSTARFILTSPSSYIGKYPRLEYFFRKAKQAVDGLARKNYEFTEDMNKIHELLGLKSFKDSIIHPNEYRDNVEAFKRIVLQEDMGDIENGKPFKYTAEQLEKQGYSEGVIKAIELHHQMQEKSYAMIDSVATKITTTTRNMSVGDLKELKRIAAEQKAQGKTPFIQKIIREIPEADGTVTVIFRSSPVSFYTNYMTEKELNNIESSKQAFVTSKKQLRNGRYAVSYIIPHNNNVGHIEGHFPHYFKRYFVTTESDGLVTILKTFDTLREATAFGNKYTEENKGEKVYIYPKEHEFTGGKLALGDEEFANTVSRIADSQKMSLEEAGKLLKNVAKTNSRDRYLGFTEHRTGAEGYDPDVFGVLDKYYHDVVRYAVLDECKRDMVNRFEQQYGSFTSNNLSKEGNLVREYINNVLGNTNSAVNEFINEILGRIPGVEGKGAAEYLSSQFGFVAAVTKLGFLNVGSALINLTQVLNIPMAIGNGGYKAIYDGVKLYGRYIAGDKTIQNLLDEDLGLKYEVGLDEQATFSKADVVRKLGGHSLFLFQKAEKMARGIALLGAYEKAFRENKANGMSNSEAKSYAIDYAKEINNKVNFDYSAADAPAMFYKYGLAGKMAFMFQKYPVKQIELMVDTLMRGYRNGGAKGALREFTKYMLPYYAMAGVWGIPFMGIFGGLLNALAMAFGVPDDWDWEEEFKKWMKAKDSSIPQKLKEYAGTIAMYGLPSMLGTDIGTRVGIGDFGAFSAKNLPKNNMAKLAQLGGVVSSSIYGAANQYFTNGNTAEAWRAISPSIGNLLVAYNGELRTTRGRVKYKYDNWYERFLRAIGIRPLNERLQGDTKALEYSEKNRKKYERNTLVDDYLDAEQAGDRDEMTRLAIKMSKSGISPKTVKNERQRRKDTQQEIEAARKPKQVKKKTYSVSDYR